MLLDLLAHNLDMLQLPRALFGFLYFPSEQIRNKLNSKTDSSYLQFVIQTYCQAQPLFDLLHLLVSVVDGQAATRHYDHMSFLEIFHLGILPFVYPIRSPNLIIVVDPKVECLLVNSRLVVYLCAQRHEQQYNIFLFSFRYFRFFGGQVQPPWPLFGIPANFVESLVQQCPPILFVYFYFYVKALAYPIGILVLDGLTKVLAPAVYQPVSRYRVNRWRQVGKPDRHKLSKGNHHRFGVMDSGWYGCVKEVVIVEGVSCWFFGKKRHCRRIHLILILY